MADSNFNPIAMPPPNLPGQVPEEQDQSEPFTNVSQPPIQPPLISMEDEPVIESEKENRRVIIVQGIILVSLIVIIFAGILLTLRVVPQVISGMSSFGKSFESYFTSTEKTTRAKSVALNTPGVTEVPMTSPIAPSGTPADLSVHILSITRDNTGTRVSMRFSVQNIGGSPSGVWSFKAELPSNATPVYYSQPQNNLLPQAGTLYTLGFTPSQNGQVRITLYTQATETNTSDKVAITSI